MEEKEEIKESRRGRRSKRRDTREAEGAPPPWHRASSSSLRDALSPIEFSGHGFLSTTFPDINYQLMNYLERIREREREGFYLVVGVGGIEGIEKQCSFCAATQCRF